MENQTYQLSLFRALLSIRTPWICRRCVAAFLMAVRTPCDDMCGQAQRNGLVVEIGSSSGLMNAYYSLHCLTRKKHGIPPQPVEFFRSIQRTSYKQGWDLSRSPEQKRDRLRALSFCIKVHGRTTSLALRIRTTCVSTVNNLVMWESILSSEKRRICSDA